MANPRAERVAKRVQQIVAEMLGNRLKDPRLELVTITEARVTGDLQQATVYFTAHNEERMKDAERALNAARGIIRSEVGKQLGLRLTPTIEFELDRLPETARSFEDVLAAARHRDAQLARQRGTEYAGDADPYRKPREAEATAAAERQFETNTEATAHREAAAGAQAEPEAQAGATASAESDNAGER
ncbi:ribosome-binding factor A [Actinobaculum suis]|uniref:Ribosome-binding factor A n=1 Tax=Actinobaculum suis TaxID=1657 RepID=A0A0K9EVX9_9ACTO|nr:30S ribosome-binding factor RbfA [Actinobaculum suis]KMY24032.1 ribosome-binding factor A [Actinobaculum suis]MDY5153936.1 30S ribosome-binding factor RbfA [Actinobaculum suis]OCA95638.1 ribosome-binding factor A [Actinobaculum suis]OCA95839.1 ribosome-binding factor A [Actinobaculum suis]SDE01705.1 ribosome-binding factor A [Actinobaculum suis]